MKKCPKCGASLSDSATECVQCGVIISKYLQAKKRAEAKRKEEEKAEADRSKADYIAQKEGSERKSKSGGKSSRYVKTIIVIGCLFVVFLFGYVATGPFLTISAIKTAVVEKNSDKLSENIEFVILRKNFKEQIKVAMMKNTANEIKDNPFSVIATGLATKMVDGIVDTFITPSGLAAMMEGEKPRKSGSTEEKPIAQKKELFKNARWSFDSASKFSVWVKNDEGEEVRFVLQRSGLSWKLVNIVIPFE